MKQVFETEFAGRHLQIETGEIAKQADGSVLVRFGETVVLATACCADEPKEGDFFPRARHFIGPLDRPPHPPAIRGWLPQRSPDRRHRHELRSGQHP